MTHKSMPKITGFRTKKVLFVCGFVLLASASDGWASPVDYSASAIEQGKKLLAPVTMYGHVGAALTELPPTLNTLLSAPDAVVPPVQLQAYLAAKGIDADKMLGGPLGFLPGTRYFTIHDTSSPYLGDVAEFPSDINEATYAGNDLTRHVKQKVTHVYVNRVGESATVYDFTASVNGTKYGRDHPAERRNFVHIELIQPRRRDPKGGAKNDAIAPIPGFPAPQLERLALLYITASSRRGQWLIPGFHAPTDAGYADAHDDPQNFDLKGWDSILGVLLQSIKATPIPSDTLSTLPLASLPPVPLSTSSTTYAPPAASRSRLGTISLANATPIPLTYAAPDGKTQPLQGGKIGYKLPGGAIYLDTDLDTDADGSPRATQIDVYGQLETALNYAGIEGQRKNVNAETVPYVVLPGGFYAQYGIGKGDVGVLIHGDKLVYVLFADVGPKTKIGEASIKAVELLGHNPWDAAYQKIVSGIDKDVITIIFPGSANEGIGPDNVVGLAEAKAKALFRALGGKVE
jgi:hypothetical protein